MFIMALDNSLLSIPSKMSEFAREERQSNLFLQSGLLVWIWFTWNSPLVIHLGFNLCLFDFLEVSPAALTSLLIETVFCLAKGVVILDMGHH